MTNDADDLLCETGCDCDDTDWEAVDLRLWQAAGYVLLGGAILGGLVLLAIVSR